MPLTSGYLLIAVAASFFFLNIFIFLKWQQLNKFILRLIAVTVAYLLLLAGSGIYLNDNFGFYNSWSELFGITNSKQEVTIPTAINLSNAKFTENGSAIIEKKFTGKASGITASVWYLIPKSIVNSIKENQNQKFPVAMFLSGSPGVPTAWLNGLKLDAQIKEAKTTSALQDFISVLPDYNIQAHVDTGCMNIPDGVQVEDWLAKDVYEYTIDNLPAKRSNWAITGYSTGGWCSTMLALKHPEIFKAAAPIASYYKADLNFVLSKDARKKLAEEYDLVNLSNARSKPLDLFLITSKGDSSSYSNTNWFYNKIGAGHNVELLTLSSGGHNFTTWKPIILDVLKWYAIEIA